MSLRILSVLIFVTLPALRAQDTKSELPKIEPKELKTKSGGRVLVFLPKSASEGSKLATVIVPPAGSRMMHGMTSGEGDAFEFLPYVAAGMAAITFDISGPWPEVETDSSITKAILDFKASNFGVKDGLEAVTVSLSHFPQLDPKRLFLAGHSSAGTLVLQMAAASDQFQGCAAFAPVTNHFDQFGEKGMNFLNLVSPGIGELFLKSSPIKHIDEMKCPIFLFHADDDSVVKKAPVEVYKKALLEKKKSVDYVSVPSGEHYDSMISDGIPKAIKWIKEHDAALTSKKTAGGE